MATQNILHVKLGESLLLLNRQADHLLNALCLLLHILDAGDHPFIEDVSGAETAQSLARHQLIQPRLLAESQYQSLARQLLKKFPDTGVDKTAAYQQFIGDIENHLVELSPFYELFADVVQFTQTGQSVLLACDVLAGLSVENGRIVFDLILNVFHKFVHVQLMMDRVSAQRKTIAAGYNLLTVSRSGGTNDPKFDSLVNYFHHFEKPLQTIADIFQPAAPFYCSLFKEATVACAGFPAFTAENLRKDHFVNLLVSPPPTMKAFDAKKMRIMTANSYFAQLTTGYLVFAGELMKEPSPGDSWKLLLGQNLNFIVSRDELFNFQEAREQLIKSSSKMSKYKTFGDAVGSQIAKALQMHKERRDALRMMMKQMKQVLDERPSIVGSKMPSIEALLKFAIDEIKWFLCHHEYTLQIKSTKAFSKQVAGQTNDLSIFELIWWTWALKNLIAERRSHIQQAVVRQMAVGIYPSLENAASPIINQRNNLPPQVVECILSVLQDVREANVDSSFQGLRVNFARLLVRFNSGADGKGMDESAKEFLNIVDQCSTISRYVDFLDQMTAELSLGFLVDFRLVLAPMYAQVFKDSWSLIPFTAVIPKIAAEFADVGSPFFPQDWDRIQELSDSFVNQFYVTAANATTELIYAVAAGQAQMSTQTSFEFGSLDKKTDKKSARSLLEKSTQSLAKDSIATDAAIEPKFKALTDSIFVLGNECVQVDRTLFLPFMYLREKVAQRFRGFMDGLIVSDSAAPSSEDPLATVKKPSIYLSELRSCISTLSTIDSMTNIGLHEVIVGAYTDYIDSLVAKKHKATADAPSALKALNIRGKKTGIAASGANLLPSYIDVYSDLLKERNLPISGFIYSEHRANFSLANGTVSSFQIFTEYSELLALCQILGPVGVTALTDALTGIIANIARDIKENLTANQETLVSMVSVWTDEVQFDEHIRKFKELENLFQDFVHIGMIDAFSSLLKQAQNEMMQGSIPLLFHPCQTAVQIPAVEPLPRSVETLAFYVGAGGSVELSLKQAMQGLCRSPASDLRVFSLIPFALAAAVRVLATAENSSYSLPHAVPLNNAHCMIAAAAILISTLIPLVAPGNDQVLREIQEDAIRVTATVLLRIRTEKAGQIPTTVKSLLCVLGQFAQHCYDIAPVDVEKFMPYSVVRSSHSDFLRRQHGLGDSRPILVDRADDDG